LTHYAAAAGKDPVNDANHVKYAATHDGWKTLMGRGPVAPAPNVVHNIAGAVMDVTALGNDAQAKAVRNLKAALDRIIAQHDELVAAIDDGTINNAGTLAAWVSADAARNIFTAAGEIDDAELATILNNNA